MKTAEGRELLLAEQKSGIVYALDPERKGEIVWQVRVGKGSASGGVSGAWPDPTGAARRGWRPAW